MSSKVFKILINVASHLSLKTLIKLSNQKLLLPLYHAVSDEKLPHIENLYQVKNINAFKGDLDFLSKFYKSITIEDAIKFNKTKDQIREPNFHLSFDDGLKEIRTIVAPILLDRGIHATFFVNSSFIDNNELFYRFKISLIINKLKRAISNGTEKAIKKVLKCEFAQFNYRLLELTWNDITIIDKVAELLDIDFTEYLKNEPYLSSEDIIWLKEKGFSIGAHSESHPRYSDISLEEQIKQTNNSLIYLEDNYNIKLKLFAFPFSDQGVNMEYFNHDKLISNFSFGTSGFMIDSFKSNLQRVPFEIHDFEAESILKAYYFKSLVKKVFGGNLFRR